MRHNTPLGCFNWLGLGMGLAVGGGFVYKWFTDEAFANTVGTVFLILFGVILGLVAVVAVLLTVRQLTGMFRVNAGPGATHYRFNVQQPGYPSPMSEYPALPPSPQMTIYPPMPEMPEMPRQSDDDDNYSPIA